MSNSSPHVLALTKASLIMAEEAGELSNWREKLSRMGEEVTRLRQICQGDPQELAGRLSAYQESVATWLTDDQRRFVSALAEHERHILLPEIAARFCELAVAEGAVADSGSEGQKTSSANSKIIGRNIARVRKPIHLVDVPAAIESVDHLAKEVCSTWGSREFEVLLNNRNADTKDADHNDFSIGVVSELVFLSDLNRMVRAIDLAAACSITVEEAYQHVEEGDRQLRGDDAWDNPLPARDPVQTNAKGPNALRDTEAREPPSELLEFIDLMVKLATNRIAIGIIIFVLVARLLLR